MISFSPVALDLWQRSASWPGAYDEVKLPTLWLKRGERRDQGSTLPFEGTPTNDLTFSN